MFQIDGPTASGGFFVPGDPASATPPTIVTSDWLNAVQQEIVTVILSAGFALAKNNSGQLLAALQAMIASGGVSLASDAETIAGAIANKAVTPHGAAALVSARVTALVGGAPAALDTLKELADAIGDDANFAGTITAALAARALASRKLQAAGLVTGGGDWTSDRTITVTAASPADYAAGQRNDVALTPASVAGGSGSNGNGKWCTLPDGDILQRGRLVLLPSGGSTASGTITFPTPFVASCEMITGNVDGPANANWVGQTVVFPGGPSLAGCTVTIDSCSASQRQSGARTLFWQAIGK